MKVSEIEERAIQYMYARGLGFLFSFPAKTEPLYAVQEPQRPAKVKLADVPVPEDTDKRTPYIPLDFADSDMIGYGRRQIALEQLLEDLEEREWMRLNELGMAEDIHNPLQRFDCRDNLDSIAASFFDLYDERN